MLQADSVASVGPVGLQQSRICIYAHWLACAYTPEHYKNHIHTYMLRLAVCSCFESRVTLFATCGLQHVRLLYLWDFPEWKILEQVAVSFSELSDPGIKPVSPSPTTGAGVSATTEPLG